jgi:hypothetical protein
VDRHVDGVVEMVLDTAAHCHAPLYQGALPIPITRRYHSWKCCMPSSIGLW